MTLRHSTRHREKLPTVQRQNYCEPGRNNDPKNPYDLSKTFCFCNDWNGCNGASIAKVTTYSIGLSTMLLYFNMKSWMIVDKQLYIDSDLW